MKTHDETPETVEMLHAEVQRFETAISAILGHPHKVVSLLHKTPEKGAKCDGVAILTTELPTQRMMHIMRHGVEAAMVYAALQAAEHSPPPPGTTMQ